MATASVNRNDPCPCGSGKKFKKCCMGKPGVNAPPAPSPPGAAPTRMSVREKLKAAMDTAARGDLDRAERLFREILQERATEADALYGLGRVVKLRGDAKAAAELFQRAIDAQPKRAPYHAALADVLQLLDRPKESLASARRAVAIDPKSVPGHSMAAVAQFRMNRIDNAGVSIGKALALAPDDANAGLIMARVETRRGEAAAARVRIEKLLADPKLPPFLRRVALHDLGGALEKLGVHDAAFDAYAESGRAQLETPEASAIDRTRAFAMVDAYRAGTTAATLGRSRQSLPDDGLPSPSFLVGFPRSGTTMTEQIMAAHPAITTSDEEDIVGCVRGELASQTPETPTFDIASMLAGVDDRQRRALRASYWRHAEALVGVKPGQGIFVDKLPLNLVHLPLINEIFPESRIIVALRDPRDVCLSCFKQWFSLNTAMIQFLDIEDTARYYAQVMDLWLYYRGIMPTTYLEVRYEDTVRDLEPQARRMLAHLGAPWDDGVLAFHEKAKDRYITTPSFAAVTEKVHTRAIGGWRNYETQFASILPVLQPYVEAFGYE